VEQVGTGNYVATEVGSAPVNPVGSFVEKALPLIFLRLNFNAAVIVQVNFVRITDGLATADGHCFFNEEHRALGTASLVKAKGFFGAICNPIE
jgi:hypothetical protein